MSADQWEARALDAEAAVRMLRAALKIEAAKHRHSGHWIGLSRVDDVLTATVRFDDLVESGTPQVGAERRAELYRLLQVAGDRREWEECNRLESLIELLAPGGEVKRFAADAAMKACGLVVAEAKTWLAIDLSAEDLRQALALDEVRDK